MEKPSKEWKCARGAALERVRRTAIEPLTPLYTIYAAVCVCFIAGFLRFQFFDTGTDLDLITALQIVIVSICGALVPILTGSVFTAHFTALKIEKLARE